MNTVLGYFSAAVVLYLRLLVIILGWKMKVFKKKFNISVLYFEKLNPAESENRSLAPLYS